MDWDEVVRDAQWRQIERTLQRQRWQIDGAKVIVVLLVGAAAGIDAAAWQARQNPGLEVAAGILLLASVLTMLVSFLVDDHRAPDVPATAQAAREMGIDPGIAIFCAMNEASLANEWTVTSVVFTSWIQALLALASGILGALAMMA